MQDEIMDGDDEGNRAEEGNVEVRDVEEVDF